MLHWTMNVTKAVIPAAGLGTRFLPQTKAMPKEMLPIIDRPVIQLAVEELVAAGVTDIIIVTGAQKRIIEDHFDRAVELEQSLIEKGKIDEAQTIRDIAEMANFVYVRQKGEPKGNARPVLNAAHLLGGEPFFYLFPDDFFYGGKSGSAAQMLESFESTGGQNPVLSLVEIDKESDTSKYGMVSVAGAANANTLELDSIVEKPGPENSPSMLASVNGYLLTPDIIDYINMLKPAPGEEIGVPDALMLRAKDKKMYGRKIEGKYLDTGSKLGYLEALMYVADTDPSVDFKR